MELLWDGIKFGVALSILVGPLLFALVQTSIEEGFRAGLMVALGIWTSDFMFVMATYSGISYIARLTSWSGFEFTLGIIGGLILFIFGMVALVLKPPAMKTHQKKAVRHTSFIALWFRGFIINTFNPFTLFFWLGISSMLFTKKELLPSEARLFYSGMLGVVFLTDIAKIALAKAIRRWLKPEFILWSRRVAGVVLCVFGVALILRAFDFFKNVI
jgi:threonine/homoserine/homoserine lactone efflux protein